METTQSHEPAIAELLARMSEMQAEIAALKEGNTRKRTGGTRLTHRILSGLHTPFGPRTRRIGMGLSLALVLLIAPSQSAVTHADGTGNTRYGNNSLPLTTTGNNNSAFGDSALAANTSGHDNTASGFKPLNANTTGSFNAAFGSNGLTSNTTGSQNTASGAGALFSNTTGTFNTASGSGALNSNIAGGYNVATGSYALASNTGDNNTAAGAYSLNSNTSGTNNTASGGDALNSNTTGQNNTAVGYLAGDTTAAANGNTTGSNNTFIGYNSGPGTSDQLTNATAIGANAVVSMSNAIVLGGIGVNTQRIGVGTTTPHSAFQVAKGFLQIRPVFGPPNSVFCQTADDAGRLVVRTDGNINLYICTGTGGWIGK